MKLEHFNLIEWVDKTSQTTDSIECIVTIIYNEKNYFFTSFFEFNSFLKKTIKSKNTTFYTSNLKRFVLNSFDFYKNTNDFKIIYRGINADFYLVCLQNKLQSKFIWIKCASHYFPLNFEIYEKKILNSSDYDSSLFKISDHDFPVEKIFQICLKNLIVLNKIFKIYNNFISIFLPKWQLLSCSNAGVSFSIFSKDYNFANLPLVQTVDFFNFFKNLYQGARCEVFGNPFPDEYVFEWDFPLFYGHCMLEEFGYGGVIFISSPTEIQKFAFYSVTVYSNMKIPILGTRHPVNKHLIFPNGRFSTEAFGEELLYFKKCGGEIIAIHYGFEFKRNGLVLKDFSLTFLALVKKQPELKIFIKSLIVSLYGRLGMPPLKSTTTILKDEDYECFVKKSCINFELIHKNLRLIRYESDETQNSLFTLYCSGDVLLAAQITAKARIKLHSTVLKCETFGGRILYWDTDGFFIAYKRNVIGETHGEIKWEDRHLINDAVFVSNKFYGIKKNQIEIIKFAGAKLQNTSLESLKSFLFKKKPFSSKTVKRKNPMSDEKTLITVFIRYNPYNKRNFINNCFQTKPLVFSHKHNKFI